MTKEASKRPTWVRFASSGMELAAAVAGFVLLGTWIDRRYGTGPTWTVVLGLVGIIGGIYSFIRSALLESRRAVAREQDDLDTNQE